MVVSSPDRTSPALISLPGFGAPGSACWVDWAEAAGATRATAKINAQLNAKPERLANRRFVISGSVCEENHFRQTRFLYRESGPISLENALEQRPLPHGSR